MARNASTLCMSTVLITLFDFLYLQLKCNIKLNCNIIPLFHHLCTCKLKINSLTLDQFAASNLSKHYLKWLPLLYFLLHT